MAPEDGVIFDRTPVLDLDRFHASLATYVVSGLAALAANRFPAGPLAQGTGIAFASASIWGIWGSHASRKMWQQPLLFGCPRASLMHSGALIRAKSFEL